MKAWTDPGPFSWEGRYWHYRYVNPWPRPFQQPHPPIWVTGSSPDNIRWIADHGYVHANFLQAYEDQESQHQVYRERCAEVGLAEPGPDKFAFLCPALVPSGIASGSLCSGFVILGRFLRSGTASFISTRLDSSPYTHPIRGASVSSVSPASYIFQSNGRRLRAHPVDQLINSARASKTRWNRPSLSSPESMPDSFEPGES